MLHTLDQFNQKSELMQFRHVRTLSMSHIFRLVVPEDDSAISWTTSEVGAATSFLHLDTTDRRTPPHQRLGRMQS